MMQQLIFNQTQAKQPLDLFREAMLRGRLYRLWAKLARRPSRLFNLDKMLCGADVRNCHYAGVHPVRIDCIQGTLGKSDAFDAVFHPVKESTLSRWLSIAREKLRGHDLPPVDLIEVNGIYYVRDGHHRISVARSLGQQYVEAEITRLRLTQSMR
jgi:uncharacterized ParB-like nuclease family protein